MRFLLVLFSSLAVIVINGQELQEEPSGGREARATHVLDYGACNDTLCVGLNGEGDGECAQKRTCHVLLTGHVAGEEAHFRLQAIISERKEAPSGQYASVGLSRDNKMGEDVVTDCLLTSDMKPKMTVSKNVGQDNQLVSNGLEEWSLQVRRVHLVDHVLSCEWTVRARVQKWDLNDKVHVLLAKGQLMSDKGEKQYHEMRVATEDAVSLKQTGFARSASDPPLVLVRLHGSLMITAWIFCVSLGIVFARYFKKTWLSSEVCSVKPWFAFHRFLMVSAVLLIILAQISIFYYLGTFRIGPHSIFGFVAIFFALTNPLGALLRPHPEADNRWLFNWGHWLGGNSGHIAAMVAIFLSSWLPLADLPRQFLWTIVSFVVFYTIIHLILQFHQFCQRNSKSRDIAMHSMNQTEDQDFDGEEVDASGSGFRRFILGVFAVGDLAFVIVLIMMISLPKKTMEMMAIT